jgi:threonine/homoserine/homoserine lactone efflux protein
MFDPAQLSTFVGVALVLVITPGPNTILILANALNGGRKAGVATVLGVETGTLIHSFAAGIGVSAVVAASPATFLAVKYAGAAYLGFLGLRAWLAAPAVLQDVATIRMSWMRTFRQAVIASVLNAKAAVFFLALLPQFVDRTREPVLAQFVTLGAIVAVVGLAVGMTLTGVVTAEIVRHWLQSERVSRWQQRVAGTVLCGLAVSIALSSE